MEVSEAFEKLSLIAAKLTIITLDNFENIKPLNKMKQKLVFVKNKKEDGLVFFLMQKIISKYKAYSFGLVFFHSELKLKDIELNENHLLITKF